ncbi:uncharacterized protein LOC129280080 [Lytechinus pictus]|uniref:uncharacterized protein LOC129280080 n=1 Tax=Lytechinus pictus TaxID=7653 RepID=UPI0030B9C382
MKALSWIPIMYILCFFPMDASTNENGSSRILSNSGCNETTAVYPNTLINETVVEGYAIFTCDIGFEMDLPDHGDAVLAVCNGTSGEWDFIDQSPKCEMISCQFPPLPAYGYFEEVSLGFGESGNYTCEQEFIVDGEATATCQADGTWSSEPPLCRVSCPTSEDSLANAYLSDAECVDVRSDSKTWNEANETCVVQGGSLVVIPTNRTLEIIQGALRNVSDGYTAGYWIGGYEAPKNSSWKWDKSGDVITDFFWANGEPTNGEKDTRIILSKMSNWQWAAHRFDDNQDENNEAIGYLCQFDSICASAGLSISDDGVFPYDGKCYFFQNVGFFKWDDANSVDGDAGIPGCLGIGDTSGFLAEIRDEDTQNLLIQLGVRSYWIGAVLEESSSGRSWLWVDGSSIASPCWGPEEPSDSNENCIDLYPFQNGGYLMNDEACSSTLRYVCEFSVTNSTTVCGDPGTPYRGYRADEISASFLPGESIEFSCNEGYEIAGASKVVCQPDGTWNETIPTCNAIECGPTPSVHNASLSHLTSSTYRGTAVYSCNEGYELVGNPSVYCMSNGDWSAADFTCQEIQSTTVLEETTLIITTAFDEDTTIVDFTTVQDFTTIAQTTTLLDTTVQELTTAVGQTTLKKTTVEDGTTYHLGTTTAPAVSTIPTDAPSTNAMFTTYLYSTEKISTPDDSTTEVDSTTISQTTGFETTYVDASTKDFPSTLAGNTMPIVSTVGTTFPTDSDVTDMPTVSTGTFGAETSMMMSEITSVPTSSDITSGHTSPSPTTFDHSTVGFTTSLPTTVEPPTTERLSTSDPTPTEHPTSIPTSVIPTTTGSISTVALTSGQPSSLLTTSKPTTPTSNPTVLPPTTNKRTRTPTSQIPTTSNSGKISSTSSRITASQTSSTESIASTSSEALRTMSTQTTEASGKNENPFPVALIATISAIFGLLLIVIVLIFIIALMTSSKKRKSTSHNLLMTDFGPTPTSEDKPSNDYVSASEMMVNSVFADEEYRKSILNYRPLMPRISSTSSSNHSQNGWGFSRTNSEGVPGAAAGNGQRQPIYENVSRSNPSSVVRFPSTFDDKLAEKGLVSFDPTKRKDLIPSDMMVNGDIVFEGTE